MTAQKIIAVIGATGAQGGGLVRAIHNDPARQFIARPLTRRPRSNAGRALGSETMWADLDDVRSLRRAFDGVHGVFGVTNFWEHMSPERELAQAKAMATAAAAAGVRHFVWSTLEDTRHKVPPGSGHMPVLNGCYNVPHADAKGEADTFFIASGVPTTAMRTSFYWDNLLGAAAPRRGADGLLVLSLPLGDKKLPGIAAADIGACALGVFKAGDTHVDQTIGIAGEHLTGQAIAAALSRAFGEPVAYHAMPLDAMRGLGLPGAQDAANMFQFKQDFEADYCAARPLALSRRLHPGLQTLDQWLARHAKGFRPS